MNVLFDAAENAFALLRVLRQHLRTFAPERIDDVGSGEPGGFLNCRTIKVAVLKKEIESASQVASASVMKTQDLLCVQKPELPHIAEEGNVAGLYLEGVGRCTTNRLFEGRFSHSNNTLDYTISDPRKRGLLPSVLQFSLIVPPHRRAKINSRTEEEGRGTDANPRHFHGATDARRSGVK